MKKPLRAAVVITSILMIAAFLLYGCKNETTSSAGSDDQETESQETDIQNTETTEEIDSAAEVESTEEEEITEETGIPGEITIYYREDAQFEFINSAGRRIFIDVFHPGAVVSQPTEQDILLITHTHGGHYRSDFANAFPGQKMVFEEGEIDLPDVTIHGVYAAHVGDVDNTTGMFLIEMEGIRIAILGCTGQDQLTQEQLDVLEKADIVITRINVVATAPEADTSEEVVNQLSSLMNQLDSHLLFPTHTDNTLETMLETWKGYISTEDPIKINRSDLPDENTIVVLGQLAGIYKSMYNLTEW